jgi:hypothetical protein
MIIVSLLTDSEQQILEKTVHINIKTASLFASVIDLLIILTVVCVFKIGKTYQLSNII